MYTAAGKTIPPTAAIPGTSIFEKLESSPSIISLFSSKPIKKKNIAIKPSFTQCSVVLLRFISPILIGKGKVLSW